MQSDTVHMLPLQVTGSSENALYGGRQAAVSVHPGLTTLVGPNGTGKTRLLRDIAGQAENALASSLGSRRVRYLSAGRSSPIERFRASIEGPGHRESSDAAIGNIHFQNQWWKIESVIGEFLMLEKRPDLRLKVEARLQQLFSRSLKLGWTQNGLGISIVPMSGGKSYAANYEASGILQLVALLAAIHNDEIGVLVIDEPEISLHPQHQAFVLQEIQQVAGDALGDATKKIVVIATHSPSMLSINSISDLPRMVFFSDPLRLPVQVPLSAPELINRRVSGLIARLGTTHRLAFFADTVMLVEGPSDEIITTQLAHVINHPLLPLNSQVVPVNGKGEFPEVAKLFRLMGKRVTVLADLDAIADSNALVNFFSSAPGANEVAASSGHSSITSLDQKLRNDLSELVIGHWNEIAPVAMVHRYWTNRAKEDQDDIVKRRAALAALLTVDDLCAATPLAGQIRTLKARFLALLETLSRVGLHVLKRGTIEDYFAVTTEGIGKPEAAAIEAAGFQSRSKIDLRSVYDDLVKALQDAAPRRQVNEDDLLRVKLAAAIAAIFQFFTPQMSSERIAAQASSVIGADAELFGFENASVGEELRLRISIRTPLFPRSTFPFEVGQADNVNAVVRHHLPPTIETPPKVRS